MATYKNLRLVKSDQGNFNTRRVMESLGFIYRGCTPTGDLLFEATPENKDKVIIYLPHQALPLHLFEIAPARNYNILDFDDKHDAIVFINSNVYRDKNYTIPSTPEWVCRACFGHSPDAKGLFNLTTHSAGCNIRMAIFALKELGITAEQLEGLAKVLEGTS